METKIENNTLIVKIPLNDPPVPSKTGKTLVIASTHGNVQTSTELNGKPITIELNAYIKR